MSLHLVNVLDALRRGWRSWHDLKRRLADPRKPRQEIARAVFQNHFKVMPDQDRGRVAQTGF